MKKRVQMQSKPPQEDCSEQLASARAEIADLKRKLERQSIWGSAFAGGISQVDTAIEQLQIECDRATSELQKITNGLLQLISNYQRDLTYVAGRVSEQREAKNQELHPDDVSIIEMWLEAVSAAAERPFVTEHNKALVFEPDELDHWKLLHVLLHKAELIGLQEASLNLLFNARVVFNSGAGACWRIMRGWRMTGEIRLQDVTLLDKDWIREHIDSDLGKQETLYTALKTVASYKASNQRNADTYAELNALSPSRMREYIKIWNKVEIHAQNVPTDIRQHFENP